MLLVLAAIFIVEASGTLQTEIDRNQCSYSYTNSLTPSKDNIIGSIDVGQEMEIEFYFTVNSQCTADWCNIINIGNDIGVVTVRGPGIWIVGTANGLLWANPNQFYVSMSDDTDYNPYDIVPGFILSNDGIEHLFYAKFTETEKVIKIDNNQLWAEPGTFTNTNYQNSYSIYVSDPVWSTADVSIRDICIVSNAQQGSKQEIIDRNSCSYSNTGSLSPSKGNIIGSIDVGQEMEVEFYYTLNSKCTADWCDIMNIGNDDGVITARLPGVWIVGSSNGDLSLTKNRFYVSASNNPLGIGWNPYDVVERFTVDADGEEHLFYIKITATEKVVKIDNIAYFTKQGDFTNTDYHGSYPIYFSDPYWSAADATVRDICIVSNAEQGNQEIAINRNLCTYSNQGPLSSSKGNIIGSIDVGQEMKVEFYYTLNSKCTADWCDIMNIGNDEGLITARLPGVWIVGTGNADSSLTKNRFYVSASDNTLGTGWNPYDVIKKFTVDADGEEHLFYMEISATEKVVKIDNVEYFRKSGVFTNTDYHGSYPIYFSDPYWSAADVTVRDVCIVSSAEQGNKQRIIDRNLCTYSNSGSLSTLKNNIVGSIDVGQEMEVEFCYTLNSKCMADWCDIMNIGNNEGLITARLPGVWIVGTGNGDSSLTKNRFYVSASNDWQGWNPYDVVEGFTVDADGEEHLFYMKVTATEKVVKIDNIPYFTKQGVFTNTNYQSEYPIYFSDPVWTAADATVCDICIVSNAPTSAPTKVPTYEPCTSTTDIYYVQFILDESGSVNDGAGNENNYQESINFVQDLIRNDINSASKISALAFGTDNDEIYTFSQNQQDNRDGIIAALESEKSDYADAYTDTYNALQAGIALFDAIGSADNRIMFLLTDGKPVCHSDDADCKSTICSNSDTKTTLKNALNTADITLYILGIGNFVKTEIECLVEDQDANTKYIYSIDDFSSDQFKIIEGEFRNILCPNEGGEGAKIFPINNNYIDNHNKGIKGNDNEYFSYKYLFVTTLISAITTIFVLALCYSFFYCFCLNTKTNNNNNQQKYEKVQKQDDMENML